MIVMSVAEKRGEAEREVQAARRKETAMLMAVSEADFKSRVRNVKFLFYCKIVAS